MSKFWDRRTVGPVEAIHPFTKKAITVDPQRDIKIGHDIGRELTRLPGLISWYMALRDTAEAAFKEARHAEHNAAEDIYTELRNHPLAKGEKRPTETEIKNLVKADTRMRHAYRTRMDAEKMLRSLRSAVDAIIEKRWILMSLTKWQLTERGFKDSD